MDEGAMHAIRWVCLVPSHLLPQFLSKEVRERLAWMVGRGKRMEKTSDGWRECYWWLGCSGNGGMTKSMARLTDASTETQTSHGVLWRRQDRS